jgi:F0F1-type ATP synthase epsilon subunit
MRARVGYSVAVAALVLALAAAPAGAQQAPTLGAPPAPDVTAQTVQTTSTTGGGGLKAWQEALIVAAGIILIGGIAVAILADSRERARRLGHGRPVTEPGQAPHRHKQRSKQQARAKGKAARAQRRRNR